MRGMLQYVWANICGTVWYVWYSVDRFDGAGRDFWWVGQRGSVLGLEPIAWELSDLGVHLHGVGPILLDARERSGAVEPGKGP